MPVLKIKKNGTWVEVWGAISGGAGGSTGNVSASRLTTITLLADAWVGDASPYSQEVACYGVNVNSIVDLQPTPTQFAELQNAEVALIPGNDQGRVIIYSIDGKLDFDMEIQVKITDVEVIS